MDQCIESCVKDTGEHSSTCSDFCEEDAFEANATATELPCDPEELNDNRAEWAEDAIALFAQAHYTFTEDQNDHEMVLSDLLCDMRHFADRKGLDWGYCLSRADRHYQEETRCD